LLFGWRKRQDEEELHKTFEENRNAPLNSEKDNSDNSDPSFEISGLPSVSDIR
jgi:hypothetical protein